MGLETATTISGLQSSNPPDTDDFGQGDDHIRLLKSVLKAQFPGVGGLGFAIPLTATEAELNYVHGVTSPIQTQLNALPFPAGTVMPFFQAAAPTGWTMVTTHNNKMLRVINTAGGGSGGSDSPILMNKVPSHTHAFTGDAVAAHTHGFTTGNNSVDHTHLYSAPTGHWGSVSAGGVSLDVGAVSAASGGQSQSHTHSGTTNSGGAHTPTGTNAANASAANWTPLYIDMILCSKN